MKILFERANITHIDTIFEWLAQDFVTEFWDNTQDHKDDILNFINGRKEPSHYCDGKYVYWIATSDGVPFAMLMTIEETEEDHQNSFKLNYLSKTGHTYSIDYMIGNKSYFGKGYGAKTLSEFLDFFRKDFDISADTFIIDPSCDNPGAKHVYMKAGFEHICDFKMEGDYSGAGKQHHLLIRRFAPHIKNDVYTKSQNDSDITLPKEVLRLMLEKMDIKPIDKDALYDFQQEIESASIKLWSLITNPRKYVMYILWGIELFLLGLEVYLKHSFYYATFAATLYLCVLPTLIAIWSSKRKKELAKICLAKSKSSYRLVFSGFFYVPMYILFFDRIYNVFKSLIDEIDTKYHLQDIMYKYFSVDESNIILVGLFILVNSLILLDILAKFVKNTLILFHPKWQLLNPYITFVTMFFAVVLFNVFEISEIAEHGHTLIVKSLSAWSILAPIAILVAFFMDNRRVTKKYQEKYAVALKLKEELDKALSS